MSAMAELFGLYKSFFFFFFFWHRENSSRWLVCNHEHADTHSPRNQSARTPTQNSPPHTHTHTFIPFAVIICSDKDSFPQRSLPLLTTLTYNGPLFGACSDYPHKELHYAPLIQFPPPGQLLCICVHKQEPIKDFVGNKLLARKLFSNHLRGHWLCLDFLELSSSQEKPPLTNRQWVGAWPFIQLEEM